MKKLLAMAIPILPGKTPQWKKFMKELTTTYYPQFVDSRKKLNVHERSFLQTTPHGDYVIITLEGSNPAEAFKNFGSQNDAFTKWFVKEAMEIHGIDLANPPKGPMPELVVDSMESVYQS